MSEKKLSEMTLAELWRLFPISLTPPDPRWAAQYVEMEALLETLLAELHPRISHIGSTAIRGIWAKPIVDVLVELADESALGKAAALLTADGFRCMSREQTRVSLNLGYTEQGFAEKVFHIHLRLPGDRDEVFFRDYLNAHPAVASMYEALKLRLWKQYEFDRDGYTVAKTAFIRQHTQAAKAQHALSAAQHACERKENT